MFGFSMVLLAGCEGSVKLGYFEQDRASAISRVQEFRKLYDGHNYSGIYQLASPVLTSAIECDAFVAAASASATQFGKYRSAQLVGSSCFPNEVRLVYHSVYDIGEATEWFIWG